MSLREDNEALARAIARGWGQQWLDGTLTWEQILTLNVDRERSER